MPAVAPASTDMLASVSRPDIDMRSMASPWNSMHLVVGAFGRQGRRDRRIRSFGVTRSLNRPRATTLIVPGTSTLSTWPSVQTDAISVAPMPNANAPNAPWLVVWLSVPTIDRARAGRSPCSARTWWQMPPSSPRTSWNFVMPWLADELADLLLVGRGLRALGRDAVVEDDGDLRRIPDPRLEARALVDLEELVDDQRGVLVRHREIDRRLDHVTDVDGRQARRRARGSSVTS